MNPTADGARAVPAAAAAAVAESSLVRDSVSFIAHNDHSCNDVVEKVIFDLSKLAILMHHFKDHLAPVLV